MGDAAWITEGGANARLRRERGEGRSAFPIVGGSGAAEELYVTHGT
jgi:hypothetical protein